MQNNLDLELKSIQIQNERLLRELAEVHKMLEKPEQQPMYSKEYYTIEDCAGMKGGAFFLIFLLPFILTCIYFFYLIICKIKNNI